MTGPSSEHGLDPDELREKLDELEVENHDLQRLVDGLRQALSDLREGQLDRLREIEERLDHAVEMQHEAATERDEALRKAETASRRLDQVHASFTWKAGRVIKRMVDPFLALRGAVKPTSPPSGGTSAVRPDSSSTAQPTGEFAVRAAELAVLEDSGVKAAYEDAASKRRFARDGRRRVAMTVSTLDFDEGRGDLFVAIGLGRYLERIGYEVVYLPRAEWYDPPPDTEIYVALLSAVDASRVPDGPLKVGWARNETEMWATNPTLNLYDLVLASSSRSLEHLEQVYAGPTGMLPIGVDLEVFYPDEEGERSAVVSTVNQWGRERDVYAALRGEEITFPLAIFGQTRGLSPDLVPYSHGPVSFFALPGIYRQAAVVLDDFNHTTIEYGNVNSRLFEAIASGAVPVANTSLGLDALGLDAVPSYTTAAELHETVAKLYSDPVARADLADELAEVVRREHSYERRAQQFHEVISDGPGSRRPTRTMVAFLPDYRSTNPYQSMLYGSIGPDFVPVPVTDVLDMKELRASYVNQAVLHIHWTAPVFAPAKDSTTALRRLNTFLGQLEKAKERGVRVVWTVHNVMPHESNFPDLEQVLRQELADKADLVHVICDRTLEEIGDRYVIPETKVRVVRHGSYVGVYPDVVASDVARERLGYTADDTVVLFLGGIRPYRGVDVLLDAFEKAVIREPSLRLLIAGRPYAFGDMTDLERRATSHPLIAANFNEIADEELQHFFKAADIVALPYRTVLNSGSAHLAFSFARPVIAARMGCLSDVEGEGIGLSFDPGDVEGLADCLIKATSLKDRKYQQAAKRHADAYTGADMSGDFLAILNELQHSDDSNIP